MDAPATCVEIHYHADGKVTRGRVADPGPGAGTSVSVVDHAAGADRSGSAVSVSSSSSGSGVSSASSSTPGRSVRIDRDRHGCTITIDERR